MIQLPLIATRRGELVCGCLTLLALLCCWDIASRLDDDPGDGGSASPASAVVDAHAFMPLAPSGSH